MRIKKRYVRSMVEKTYDGKEYVDMRFIPATIVLTALVIFLCLTVALLTLWAVNTVRFGSKADQATCTRLAAGRSWYLHNVLQDHGSNTITTCTVLNPKQDYQL